MSLAAGPRAAEGRSFAARWVERLRPLPATNHVALGTFCHIASTLRETGLRRWTGPFDWIFSTPNMATECLADGFAGFLDPAALVSVPATKLIHGAKRQCHHGVYEARFGLQIVFNHHDPVTSAADSAALGRAVRRMRAALWKRHRNQLYMMSEIRWPEADIVALARTIGALPSRNTLVIVTAMGNRVGRARRIAPVPGLGCPVIDVALETMTRSNGLRFPDPADEAFLAATVRELAADFEARPAGPA